MEDTFQHICEQARRAAVMTSIADTLEWDQQTRMPMAAGEYRATQVATLRGMAHQTKTDPQYGSQLGELASDLDNLSGDQAVTVRELFRDWNRDCKLPADLVQRISEATALGHQTWQRARQENNFPAFRDSLKTIIELKREMANRLADGTDQSPYEALMDEYEPGANVEHLNKVFEDLRKKLVDLIARIADSPTQPDLSILQRTYDVSAQRKLSAWIAKKVGFDFSRGRLDETAHPFCTTLGPNDCRILTRYQENWLPAGLFGTLHEAGHGMYEQGLRTDFFGLPPGQYVSLGIHESQSRLWENQVGRSSAFWNWFYPEVKKFFQGTLDDVSQDDFYFAINAVRPSLIRVEADEATYNLHILIRFALEQQLIDGNLSVDDLPAAWNDRYESDLGIRPTTDADGVLQDVHWSAGLIGYFPTYTLGNLAAAQLFDTASEEIGDLSLQFTEGQFEPLLAWLRERVHRHGRSFSADSLVQNATSKPLSADALIQHLTDKLNPLFKL